MNIIKAEFVRFSEVSLFDTLGSIGVYLIWDSKSGKTPSYIGRNSILNLLVESDNQLVPPLDGYIAILGHEYDQKAKRHKEDAEMLEAALLWIAKETRRLPRNNIKDARLGVIGKWFSDHGGVKFYLYGYDPFSSPHSPKEIKGEKRMVKIVTGGKDDASIEYNWNKL